MNRRGFFNNIFKSDEPSGPIHFYGIQIVINTGINDETRAKLHAAINVPVKEGETPEEKKAFFKNVTALLLENEPFFEYGYWDYLTDAAEAQAEFDSWVNEIESSMATESGEVGETMDEQYRMSAEKQYVVISLAFLIENVPTQESFQGMIDIPEESYFLRETWPKLIEAVPYLDFNYVMADAVFIMPGNEKDGFSFEDLHSEGWEYLKPIS